MTIYKCFFVIFLVVISCKNNRLREVIIGRYDDGKVKIVKEYINDNDTESFKIKNYFSSGNLFQIGTIKNDKYYGKKITYYPNDSIYQIDSLYFPQKIDSLTWTGEVTRFYQNGKISQHYYVLRGERTGIFKSYDERGKLVKEYEVDDTMRSGKYIEYDTNEKKTYQTYYKVGKHLGMEYYFNASGDTLEYDYYENGEYKLPFKKQLKNGNALIGKYLNGDKTKVEWIWYDSNKVKIKSKINFSRDRNFVIPE